MNDDLLTQLRAYGHHVESEMTPLEIEHVGDPLVALAPEPPKLRRTRVYALVAAAAVSLVVLPVVLIRDPNGRSPAGSTTSPTATTTAFVPPSETVLRPGESVPGLRVTVNVPDGWTDHLGYDVFKNNADPPNGMAFGLWHVKNIYTDRCQRAGSPSSPRPALLDPPVGPAVNDLATALAEHWGSDATAPIEVVVDGFAGKHMVLTIPTDVDFADCDLGQFGGWLDHDGGQRLYQGPGQIEQLWILDVDGVRLVINASYFPQTSLRDRAELQQIIDSIQIESD